MNSPGSPPPAMPPSGMPPAYGMPPPAPMRPHTALPLAGGALILVAGLLGIIMWGVVLAIPALISSYLPGIGSVPMMMNWLSAIVTVCGAIGIILSLLALLGGVFGIMRRMWGIAILGGIMGIFAFGFGVGSLLSLIGTILVAMSHQEFA